MSRKKFIGLIFMMLFSLAGIIWVQLIWIRNAINIRNESFNAIASASINDAARSIESSRKMNFLWLFQEKISGLRLFGAG